MLNKVANLKLRPNVIDLWLLRKKYDNKTIEDKWMLEYISKLIYDYYEGGTLDVTKLKNIIISKSETILFDRYNNTDSSNLVFSYNDDKVKIEERLLEYCGKKGIKKNTGS